MYEYNLLAFLYFFYPVPYYSVRGNKIIISTLWLIRTAYKYSFVFAVTPHIVIYIIIEEKGTITGKKFTLFLFKGQNQ